MLSHLLSTLGVLVNFTIAKNVSKKEVSEERKRLKKIHKKEDPETIEKILIDYLTKKHSSNSGILPPGMVVNKKFLQKEKLDKATNLGEAPDNIKCPKCKSLMIVKLSRGGKFYSCSRYPDCDGALTQDGKELEGPKETGEICPDCGEKKGGKLVIRERRDGTGTFISCSRYPKCKFIKQDEAELARKRTDVLCPECKEGYMSERRGRFGIFYSCSNYPKCKFAIKAKPTGKTCKLCDSLMMEGTKTIPERCSKKDCPNFRPDKMEKIKK
jgi:ssDNA-binding Zn-finger/Zn-ribbon topoisomerase 1